MDPIPDTFFDFDEERDIVGQEQLDRTCMRTLLKNRAYRPVEVPLF